MKTKELFIYKIIIFILLFTINNIVYAVPPPDFIIQVVSQIWTIFAIIFAMLSWFFWIFYQFIKNWFYNHKKKIIFTSFLILLFVSLISAYYYDLYLIKKEQKIVNDNWMNEIKNNNKIQINNNSWNILENNNIKKESLSWNVLSSSFYIENKKDNLIISNKDFLNTKTYNNYIILDTREDLEYNIWHIPNSIHIRMADLKNWKYQELPKDKFIYVICWSAMRWKEVANFLDSKELTARYLENWVDSRVSFWWDWEWEVKFSKIYDKENYKLVFNTKEVKEKIKNWVKIVDVRDEIKFKTKTINWAVNISFLNTPTEKLDISLSQIKSWSEIITMCDDYINCFDAKITWIELEKRWINFLWRYNKPWEF